MSRAFLHPPRRTCVRREDHPELTVVVRLFYLRPDTEGLEIALYDSRPSPPNRTTVYVPGFVGKSTSPFIPMNVHSGVIARRAAVPSAGLLLPEFEQSYALQNVQPVWTLTCTPSERIAAPLRMYDIGCAV
jgi:hypothetical protein